MRLSLRLRRAAIAAVFLVPAFFPPFAPSAETTLYVSPDGRDGNPGTRAKPLGGLHVAIRAARAIEKTEPVTVVVRPGTYRLDKPLVFTPADSGEPGAPVVFRAEKAGTAIVSGGIPVGGWKKDGKRWRAAVPAVRAGDLYFRQLFVNGRRAVRARTPNTLYLRTAGPLRPLGDRMKARRDKSKKMGFRFRESDLADWPDLADVTIKLYHSWTASLHWIAKLDAEKRTVTFTNPCAWPVGYWEKFERYRVENCRAALDAPGEWYLDRRTGTLYYHPLPGERIDRVAAVAPRLTQLLVFRGDPANGAFVEHLQFRGLSFRHADWQFDRTATVDGQAHAKQTLSPVTAVGLRNAAFVDCEIAHVGSHAVRLDTGCMDNRIARCHIHDCGGGGIYVGPAAKVGYLPPKEDLKVRRNIVENNFIHDITRVLGGSIGIWVGSSSFNTIRHNEICDFDYTGISVGWCWGRSTDIYQRENIIAYNHIHHNGGDLLSDNGGIYVLGYSPGSVIRGNHIHHIYHYPHINDSRGIYLDGNTSEYLVENNLVHDIGSFGVTLKGQHNRVRNNIFAFCGDSGFNRLFKAHAKDFAYDQSSLTGNIVFQDGAVMTSGYYAPRWTEIDRNLYWSVKKKTDVRFTDWSSRILKDVSPVNGVSFAQWKALGRDPRSIAADPRFRDAAGRDFRLAGDSPAKKIAFAPFDAAKAGLVGDAAWTALPGTIERRPLQFAPPPRNVPFFYDFESYGAGEVPMVVGRIVEDGACRIRTAQPGAAGSRACLQFTDAKSSRRWYPHWYVFFRPPEKGRVTFSCDLLNDEKTPARFNFAFRDYTTKPKWSCGPRVSVSPDGTLAAGNRQAGRIEPGTWTRVEIAFPFSPAAEKVFSLSVTPRGGKKVTVTDLPFGSEDFSACTWLGFSSLDDSKAAYRLDNIRMNIN